MSTDASLIFFKMLATVIPHEPSKKVVYCKSEQNNFMVAKINQIESVLLSLSA